MWTTRHDRRPLAPATPHVLSAFNPSSRSGSADWQRTPTAWRGRGFKSHPADPTSLDRQGRQGHTVPFVCGSEPEHALM